MPNWITNYVEIKGEPDKMAELVAKCLKHDDNTDTHDFDFNGVIPMPEELNIAADGSTDIGLAAFNQQYFDRYSRYPWFAERYGNAKTADEFRAFLDASKEKAHKEILEAGRKAAENVERYGYPTWYEWSIANWDTKWNAHELQILKNEPGRLVVQFDTAWSPPELVFDKLVEMGFEVNCCWQDEDESNYGTYGDPWNTFDRRIEYDFLG